VALAAGAGSFWYLNSDQPAKFATITGGASARDEVAAELVARYGAGEWLPPAWLLAPAAVMILLGVVVLAGAVWGTGMLDEKPLEQSPLLTWLPYAVPLPFVAIACGWVVREVGRQPWVVQGLLRTEDAVTPAGTARVVLTTTLVALLCVAVSVAAVVLVRRTLRRGADHFDGAVARSGATDASEVPHVPSPRSAPDPHRTAPS
jgi:cytochrome d ubiquinol oxidase subunit I